jgi:Cdc6-like AAA superfamily ATPase
VGTPMHEDPATAMPSEPPSWVDTRLASPAVDLDTQWIGAPRARAAALALAARIKHRRELARLLSGPAHCLLYGPPGSGKTTLAAGIVTQVLRDHPGQDVRIYTIPPTSSHRAASRRSDGTSPSAPPTPRP